MTENHEIALATFLSLPDWAIDEIKTKKHAFAHINDCVGTGAPYSDPTNPPADAERCEIIATEFWNLIRSSRH